MTALLPILIRNNNGETDGFTPIQSMSKKLEQLSKEDLLELVYALKKRKKFGLVWEDKIESVIQQCEAELPVLDELPKRAITAAPGEKTNFILEGDNYHSLSILNYTHAGMVSAIYIDPPYNTGQEDFIYNDNYVDREDTFRHSKWLSFMSVRLHLAKSLLKSDGMIFVSIDDNEVGYLRVLMDEVFGEENFINCISVKTKSAAGASGGGEDKKLKKNVEYLLWYAKSRDEFSFNNLYISRPLEEVIAEKEDEGKSYEYRSVIRSEGKRELYKVVKDGSGADITIYKHVGYEITTIPQIISKEGLTREAAYLKYFDQVFRTTNAQTSIRTRVMEATQGEDGLFSIDYVPRSGKSKGQLTTNHYLGAQSDLFAWLSSTAEKTKTKILKKEKLGTLWDDLSWNGLAAEGGVKFAKGKKPLAFITRILQLIPDKDALILDFFAGSGTTGHATLLQNSIDGGKRTFILATNDESGIASETTYPRIVHAIEGLKKALPLPANLRYLKTAFVSKQGTSDQTRYELVAKCTDMIRLKEDAFKSVTSKGTFSIYQSLDSYVAIVYDSFDLTGVIDALNTLPGSLPVNIYLFSLSNDDYASDFEGLSRGYSLKPIPEGILEVYRRIFKETSKGMGV